MFTFVRMTSPSNRSMLVSGEEGYPELQGSISAHFKQGGKVFLLTDENSYRHCMPKLLESVPVLEHASILEVESGEHSKDLAVVTQLWHALTEGKASRDDLFINFGGGVICDLGGFAASAFKRGLRTINIPTTLLAQADAAIGGKSAVNFRGIKNQLGFFSVPHMIILDSSYLETLPQRLLLAGMAEIIKLGIAIEPDIWTRVTRGDSSDSEAFRNLIIFSALTKERVTVDDLYDQGERKKLNFGHTIGHVLESLSMKKDKDVMHGEAVAAGMICESWIAFRKGLLGESELNEISEFLSQRFPYVDVDPEREEVQELLIQDKKRKAGITGFVLPVSIGSSVTSQEADHSMVMASFEYYRKLYGKTD